MGPDIFLDANIILDQALKRSPHYDLTRQLFQCIVRNEYRAFTSPSIIHIIGYWLKKVYGITDARNILLTLLNDVRVLEQNHEIAIQALHSTIPDIEDALQYHTAIHHKIDCFVSRDNALRKMQSTVLPIVTPEELLRSK
jgi:predicted nucleic acid-binding protein